MTGPKAAALLLGLIALTARAQTGEIDTLGHVRPASLASADFDSDGVPDLAAGFASPEGAFLLLYRGNADALTPNSPEGRERRRKGEFTDAPFLAPVRISRLPETPAFLAAGDFDADGHWDLVSAARAGRKLTWLPGNGKGGFGVSRDIPLPGEVTALVAGEINRADGLTDLIVGLGGQEGARALVFEHPDGALRGAPETLLLPAQASAFALARLDEDTFSDLVIAAGSELLFFQGRDRKLSLDQAAHRGVPAAAVRRHSYPFQVLSVAAGNFADDHRTEIAVLGEDGTIRLFQPDDPEKSVRAPAGQMARGFLERWQEGATIKVLAPQAASLAGSAQALLAARVSTTSKENLLVLEAATGTVHVVEAGTGRSDDPGLHPLSDAAASRLVVTRPGESEIFALLPMRLDGDALTDFVLLEAGRANPTELTAKALVSLSAATFTVNSNADLADVNPGNGECKDAQNNCTLRAAIQESNANPGADTITFAIPAPGVPAIALGSLPTVAEALTIDGTTQAAGRVAITGTSNGTLMTLAAGSSVVRGLVFNGTANFGLRIQSSDNIVEGNYFGTDANGTAIQGNLSVVVYLQSGSNNRIGGTTPAARNVIAGSSVGIRLDAGSANVIEGNSIGTDVTGSADLGSTITGIRCLGGTNTTIGGAVPGAGNLVSGNAEGIRLDTPGNIVQGNRIGTNAGATAALANDGAGVFCSVCSNPTIGGTSPAARNVISGNGSHGIVIFSGASPNAVVQGNFIGTNGSGTGAVPNLGHGIAIQAASDNLIGGTAAGAGNLISGNFLDGVALFFALATNPQRNLLQGNLIGTDVTGTVAVGNAQHGISLTGVAETTIGGTTAAARNVISGNTLNGILVASHLETDNVPGVNPNLIRGNFIGTNVFGTGGVPNGMSGIRFPQNTIGNSIGGTAPGEANTIAFNTGDGLGSTAGRAVHLLPNSIFGNAGLGIDRGDDGVTPNNPSIFSFENFPVITAATTSGGGTTITGTLLAYQNKTFELYFFSNPTCDPSGYGEGQAYAGTTSVTTNASGMGTFSVNITPGIPGGQYVTAFAVATDPFFEEQASEFSFCRLVTGDPSPPATVPLSLAVIVPPKGGDTAQVTVRITGEGIRAGATARLVRAGFSDILAVFNVVDPSGGSIRATFPLAGAARGLWDVVVMNPGGATATLPQAFEVVAAAGHKTWVQLVGQRIFRVGRKTTLHLIYGNRGDVDAHGLPIWIGGIPSDATVELITPFMPMPDLGGPRPDYSLVPKTLTLDNGEQVIPLLVPLIVPNETRVFSFSISVPTGRHFELHVGVMDPMFGSPLTQAWLKCAKELIGLIAELNPIADCFLNTLSFLGETAATAASQEITSGGVLSFAEGAMGVITACAPIVLGPAGAVLTTIKIVKMIMSGGTFLRECSNAIALSMGLDAVTGADPNVKVGPEGSGPPRYVNSNEPTPYAVFFENLETATAPAQEVVVTDQLDPNAFDLASFEFGPVVVGDEQIPAPPPGVSTFTSDLDLRPDVDSIVRLTGEINRTTGLVAWRFLSLDPATGQEETDPLGGFLPPNTNPPIGEGATLFFVRAKNSLMTGTSFSNTASIVFDTNPAIVTPLWTNTVDKTPPTSQVTSAMQLPCANFDVTWGGSDAHSGIRDYTLYVSENGGPYTTVLLRTTQTFHSFAGHAGSTYAFYTIARDAAGNAELPPVVPDVSATASAGGQCFYTVTPCRVADTRWIPGGNGAPALAASTERFLEVAQRCGIPASARSISANVTITQSADQGFLALYPAGTPLPLVSNINYRPGQTRANNVVLPLGTDGKIAVACGQATGTVNFILDVNGYFQ